MWRAVQLLVGAVSCFFVVVYGNELDDLDDLSHMIDNLERKTAQVHLDVNAAWTKKRGLTVRNAHSLDRCECDPANSAQRSATLVCRKEKHSCRYNARNRGPHAWHQGVDWWGDVGLNDTCTGDSRHISVRVMHPDVSQIEQLHALHNASHWTTPAHRCRMLSPDDCACCDCAAQHFCWSPKILGLLAFQGPGAGAHVRHAAGTNFRRDKCVRLSDLSEVQCRAECAQVPDCEGIAMHGGSCVLARRGCLNRGCVVHEPAGSDPYQNGCYHQPDPEENRFGLHTVGLSGWHFATGLRVALRHSNAQPLETDFVQLRGEVEHGICPPPAPKLAINVPPIRGWAAGRFFRALGLMAPFVTGPNPVDPRNGVFVRHIPDDDSPERTVTKCAELCARNPPCVAFEYDNRNRKCQFVSEQNRTAARDALRGYYNVTDPRLFGLVDPTAQVLLPSAPAPADESKDPVRDSCVYSPWSGWSPCSRECGVGTHSRVRIVLSHSTSGNATRTRVIARRRLEGQPCGALMQQAPCHTKSCPIVDAWQTDVYLMKDRTQYPGGPAAYPTGHNHIWNGDFSFVRNDAPLGWVKDPKLVWSVSRDGLKLTGAAKIGFAGIVQRYVAVQRGLLYMVRAEGGGTNHAQLFVRDSSSGARARSQHTTISDAEGAKPRFSSAPGVVQAIFVAQSDLIDVGVYFDATGEDRELHLTYLSLRRDFSPTSSPTPAPPTPSPTPAPKQLVWNPSFAYGEKGWFSHDGGKISVVTSDAISGREMVVEPPAATMAGALSQPQPAGRNPGVYQLVSGLLPGSTYRFRVTGRLQHTVNGKHSRRPLDPALARLWVSTGDDRDILWGRRADSRLHPSNSTGPYSIYRLDDGSTRLQPSPGYRTGALVSGARSQNQTVTFTVPPGVHSARVGVLLCCGFTANDVVFITSMSLERVQPCRSFQCRVEHHRCHFGTFSYWAAARSSDSHAVAHLRHAKLKGRDHSRNNNCDGRQHFSLRVYHQNVEDFCAAGHTCHATSLKPEFCARGQNNRTCQSCICEASEHHSENGLTFSN